MTLDIIMSHERRTYVRAWQPDGPRFYLACRAEMNKSRTPVVVLACPTSGKFIVVPTVEFETDYRVLAEVR